MLRNHQKRFRSSKQSFLTPRNMFQENFFMMVPPLVPWSPLKTFFRPNLKISNYA